MSTGGGIGRYGYKNLEEIDAIYQSCAQDRSMRGVSAILRIAREQIDARGGLGDYNWMLHLALAAIAVSAALYLLAPEPARSWGLKGVIGGVAAGCLVGYATFSTREVRSRYIREEMEIHRKTVEVLSNLVSSPGFQSAPLDFVQRLTLQTALKRSPTAHPEVRKLL